MRVEQGPHAWLVHSRAHHARAQLSRSTLRVPVAASNPRIAAPRTPDPPLSIRPTGKPTTANSTRFDEKDKEISPGPGTYINQIERPPAKPEFDEARNARRKLDMAAGAAGGK